MGRDSLLTQRREDRPVAQNCAYAGIGPRAVMLPYLSGHIAARKECGLARGALRPACHSQTCVQGNQVRTRRRHPPCRRQERVSVQQPIQRGITARRQGIDCRVSGPQPHPVQKQEEGAPQYPIPASDCASDSLSMAARIAARWAGVLPQHAPM